MKYEQGPLSVLLPHRSPEKLTFKDKTWNWRVRSTCWQITPNIFTWVRVSQSKEWMFGSQYQDFCIPNLRLLPSAGVIVSNFGFKYAGCPCGPFLFFKGVWPWPHQITEHEFLEAHSDDLQHKTSNALVCMSTRKFLRQVLQSITAAGHKGHCLEDQHKRYVFIPSHREPFSWLWWLKITRSSTDYRAVLSLWNPLAHIRTHSQCTKLSLAISWQGQKCTDKQQVQT